jgi:2-oxo-4-hydroxy-4-carboxy-5-ureidoimidazoline decarboxylase
MTLQALNRLDTPRLTEALRYCCGSSGWVGRMLAVFPVTDEQRLFDAASDAWRACGPADWLEAFAHHPAIGAKTDDAVAAAEQSGTRHAPEETLRLLAKGNKAYQEKFGYIYIVCATGRSAVEMLDLLVERLTNTPEEELRIAMGEQEKITRLRLEKLLT